VKVELSFREDIVKWSGMKIPTLDFVDRSAIAKIDRSIVPRLKDMGFLLDILDWEAANEEYFIAYGSEENLSSISKGKAWRIGNGKVIIKSKPEMIIEAKNKKLKTKIISNKALPDRFWESLTMKTVFVNTIEYDPFVGDLVDQVNADSLTATIRRLQDFGTRLALSDSCYVSEYWVKNKLEEYGCLAEYDSFYHARSLYFYNPWPDSGYERNVLGRSFGVMRPEVQYIVCGHLDATTLGGYPHPIDTSICRTNAPGADDDATGIAATMEIARIFGKYTWEPTITYACWAAEESYLLGSGHFAGEAESLDVNIGGLVNMDMVGYMNDGTVDCILGGNYDFCQWLSGLFYRAAEIYAPELLLYPRMDWVSDDEPFSSCGYPAIGLIEYPDAWVGGNPYYHTTDDRLNTLVPEFYTAVTKAALATMALLGTHPGPVEGVDIAILNSDLDLEVRWSASPEMDVTGYYISWGKISGNYDNTIFSPGRNKVQDTLTGIYPDQTYYIIVKAVDSGGRQSIRAFEKVVPLPKVKTILIVDNDGGALDASGESWTKYIEASVASLGYMYSTETVDQSCSFTEGYLKRFPLIIWNLGPDFDKRVDSDYSVFNGKDGENLQEYLNAGGKLWMIGQKYLWAGSPDTAAHPNLWTDYLKLSSANGWSNIPCSTAIGVSGDPIGDGFVDSVIYYYDRLNNNYWLSYNHGCQLTPVATDSSTVGFMKNETGGYIGIRSSADSLGGYMFVYTAFPFEAVSSSKQRDTLAGRIIRWLLPESLDYVPPAIPIGLTSEVQDSHVICEWRQNTEGDLAGYNVFRALQSGFPQWIKIKTLASQDTSYLDTTVLYDSIYCYAITAFDTSYPYNESAFSTWTTVHVVSATGIESVIDKHTPRVLKLSQNSPNPFNNKTTIVYQLPKTGKVGLNIYNIAGQLVRTLVSHEQRAGCYSITWDRRDNHGAIVGSGVYIYGLNLADKTLDRKMLVIK
jgi:hypothetical protein